MTYKVTGSMFAEMVKSGAANLQNNAKTVNDLNVFPIPDGDTGDNMARTVCGGTVSFDTMEKDELSSVAKELADGMLLSARGNSGVILSQFFEGIHKGFSDVSEADTLSLGQAFRRGVETAYSAVIKPVEGTILTVMREATEYAIEHTDTCEPVEVFFDNFMKEMYESLDRTPELLPVLKESGVIDSGGAGFVYIIEGMNRALRGKTVELTKSTGISDGSTDPDVSKFDRDSSMEFGYCTEFILQLLDSKTDVDAFEVESLVSFLEENGGESIVAFKTGTRIKVHVHTFKPEKILAYCHKFGEFISLKIENMALQHNDATVENRFARQEEREITKERKKYASVTVADGDGLIEAFRQFGADYVIDGKQTMNPSTEDFLCAFEDINAENIFVFPNNSNIVLAARQAASMYEKSKVFIVPTTTIAQGYSAFTMLDYSSDDPDTIAEELLGAAENVTTGLITYSVRDCNLNDIDIKKNDWIAILDKEIVADTPSKTDAAIALLQKTDMTDKEVIVLICGKDTSADEVAQVRNYIKKNLPLIELFELDGGQDIYSFIFAIE